MVAFPTLRIYSTIETMLNVPLSIAVAEAGHSNLALARSWVFLPWSILGSQVHANMIQVSKCTHDRRRHQSSCDSRQPKRKAYVCLSLDDGQLVRSVMRLKGQNSP